MRAFIISISVFVFSITAYAKQEIIYPIGEKEMKTFLQYIQYMDPIGIGFDPKKVKVKPENKEGSSLLLAGSREFLVYHIDINNDSRKEYVVIYIREGSLNTSGIASVIAPPKPGRVVKASDYDIKKIINKNLWNRSSRDMSKFHLYLARPFIVKRGNQYIMRFLDAKSKKKVTAYLWKKLKFTKIY